jgi:hypothetical protein
MKLVRLTGIASLWLILSISFVIQAQSCPTLVNDALSAIGDNCDGLTRNTACYGYDRVSATFLSEVPEDFFIQPADVTDIVELETLTTAALNLSNNIWGVAVMSLQADIPDSLPGQAVTFVLMGDVEVENAVEPDDSAGLPDPVEVTVGVASANVRTGPGLNRNVVGGVVNGDTLQADGVSRDGEWVRVIYDGLPAWIALALLTADSTIAGLPTLGVQTFTPMQSFYLRTGIGAPACEEAPDDSLLIQSPENMEVELTVNGANINIGSTVLLRILEPGNRMEIIVFDGRVITEDGQIIREGYRSVVCLSEPDSRGVDGESNDRVVSCPWSEPEFVPPLELAGEWCVLEGVPASPLDYPVDLLCDQAERDVFFGTGASVEDDDLLLDTGDVCDGFGLVYPINEGAPANWSTFQWNAAPGADEYALNFYDYQGNFGTTIFVPAPATSTDINMGGIPSGGSFQWEVIALQNGVPICNTGRTAQQTRLPDYNEPPGGYANATGGGGSNTISWSCGSPGFVIVNYAGLPGNEDVSITFDYYDGTILETAGFGFFTANASGTGTDGFTATGAFGSGRDLKSATWFSSPNGLSGSLPTLFGCGEGP